MRRLGDWWFRLRALLRPGAMEQELDAEFAFHLEMEARKLMDQGRSADQARREAERRFGGMAAQREAARDSWGIGLARDFIGDVRHSLRQLRRRPGFALLGILTLALGLASTIGLGGVVRGVLVRPLPVSDEDRVRVFWGDYDWRGVEFDFVKERTKAFAPLAAFTAEAYPLRTDDGSSVVVTGLVSAEFFDVIGIPPLLGRTFRAGEDRPGSEPVVVLSHGAWQQELGGDPAVVGRRIVLDGAPRTVIGVMPRGFFFPSPEFRIWAPLNLDPASGQYQGNGWLNLFGRLRPSMTEPEITGDLQAIARALGERFTYPAAWDKTKDPAVRSLREYLVGDVRPALLLLLGAGSLLLLMACANVAALLLARTTDRTQEIALRAALGAGRGRLARQIVTESLVFSGLAGLAGLAMSGLGFGVLVRSLPLRNGLGATIGLDWTALVGGLVLSTVVGLAVAAAPVRDLLAGRLSGLGPTRGVRGLGRGAGRVHAALVATEAGVAVVLVVGALLFIRSVERLLALDLGLEPGGVVAVDVQVASDVPRADRTRVFDEILARTEALPGVASAALVTRLPIRDGGWQGTVQVAGRPELQGAAAPNALYRPVTPGYFRTLGLDIRRGRGIESTDRWETGRVGLVSEAFAARAWPGEDPIGRELRTNVGGDTLPISVVGVVEEAKLASVSGANPFVLYLPHAQQRFVLTGYVMVIRADGAGPTLATLRRVAGEVDPRIALNRFTTMDQVVSASLAEPLQLRFFLSLFAAVALALGVVGVYSVVSYSVARRQTEFGVRLALGAEPGRVVRQVIGHGVAPVLVGTGVGIAAAVALGRVASRLLYGVAPSDPVSLVVGAGSLAAAGVLAALLPAWRASRVSPVDSLRAE